MGKESRDIAIDVAYGDADPPELATPEKNLLRAVLINAISDISHPGEMNRKATDFFLCDEDDYIFSFRAICSFLEVEPNYILYLVGLKDNPRPRKSDDKPPQS